MKNTYNINYAHASLNFKLNNVLFGVVFSKNGDMSDFGGGVGYQSKNVKVMTHGFFGETRFQEITVSYLLSPKK